jgi:hypothetical protein
MLARTFPVFKSVSKSSARTTYSFGKKMSDLINPELIPEQKEFTPEVADSSKTYNFNREEYP